MSLSHFQHPFDIAKHPALESEMKRAIPASLASDAAALKDSPNLRRAPGGTRAVPVDDVLDALNSLDG